MSPLISIALKLFDKVIPDKSAREKAKLDLLNAEQQGDLKDLEIRLSAIIAEAQSADPWTSRARPTFLYVVYILILAAIPMGVLYSIVPMQAEAIATGFKAWLEAIPSELYALFGAGYLGYSHYRSNDKKLLNR